MDRRAEEDRRKIERFTSPPIREHFRQIKVCVRLFSIITFAAVIYSLISGVLSQSPADLTFGFFMAFVFALLTAFLHRYALSISEYLANESIYNLDRSMERQSILWIVGIFLAIMWVIVYFVFN